MTALSTGLTAIKEARDFAPAAGREGEAINVADVSRTHRTTILKDSQAMSPILAQQQYYNLACHQLSVAVGGEPAGSQALYSLGRIQTALAGQSADPGALHLPQALVFHQAALAVDARNHMAANELGVLLARFGQLPAARQALLHSVTLQPHVEGWHNLATVHQRLGEPDLAKLAASERDLLGQTATGRQIPSAHRSRAVGGCQDLRRQWRNRNRLAAGRRPNRRQADQPPQVIHHEYRHRSSSAGLEDLGCRRRVGCHSCSQPGANLLPVK